MSAKDREGREAMFTEVSHLASLIARVIDATRANVIEDVRISCVVTITARFRGRFQALQCILHPGARLDVQLVGDSKEACDELARVLFLFDH
jgi:hypothetical protein